MRIILLGTNMSDHVRTIYIPDVAYIGIHQRMVTLVTRLNGDGTVTYAYSVNNPPRMVLDQKTSTRSVKVYRRVPGDIFSKKIGRGLAMTRLAHKETSVTIPVEEGCKPVDAVLFHMSITAKSRVAVIADDELYYRQNVKELARIKLDVKIVDYPHGGN